MSGTSPREPQRPTQSARQEDSSGAGGPHDPLEAWTRDWGQLLRTARQVAGMSLTDLSERSGLSKGYLSKLESGQDGARNPSRATLVALARALPSFRPLAYQLEPAESSAAGAPLAFAEAVPRPPQLLIDAGSSAGEAGEATSPIEIGWRELEALVALLALDRSGSPHPLSALLVARALDRPRDQVIPALERLTRAGVLRCLPPLRPGAAPTYAPQPALEERVGLSRLGDALVLAAALLAQAPALRRRQDSDDGPRSGRPR